MRGERCLFCLRFSSSICSYRATRVSRGRCRLRLVLQRQRSSTCCMAVFTASLPHCCAQKQHGSAGVPLRRRRKDVRGAGGRACAILDAGDAAWPAARVSRHRHATRDLVLLAEPPFQPVNISSAFGARRTDAAGKLAVACHAPSSLRLSLSYVPRRCATTLRRRLGGGGRRLTCAEL